MWNKILLENIILHIPNFIFWKDTNFQYLGCNENYAQLLGLKSPTDIIGKTDYDLEWHSDGHTANFFRQRDQEILDGKTIINLEQCLSTKTHNKVVVILNKIPLYDEDNNIIGILGVSTDITSLKHAEENEKLALHQLAEAKAKAKAE